MADPNAVTPMMAQFLEIKDRYPDALLFYRMGDFYELFFDDAEAASAALDIALTKRGKHKGADIPMCGVPVHAAEGYLLTLIRKGFRVAVCEQLEDPAEAKKRGSKAVVKRDVVRLVTPGTLTEDSLLAARQNNFLAAWAEVRGDGAIAWTDISTGEFFVKSCPRPALSPELARLAPRELLVQHEDANELYSLAEDLGLPLCERARSDFDSTNSSARLKALFQIDTLEGFGEFTRPELGCLGAIVAYLDITGAGQMPRMRPPQRQSSRAIMSIDAPTRRNLELTNANAGGREGSLLWVIDQTVTGGGARLLAARLTSPSTEKSVIDARLDSIDFFCDHNDIVSDLIGDLRQCPDMDRALARLSLDRGGPRDLAAIRDGLACAGTIGNGLARFDDLTGILEQARTALAQRPSVLDDLTEALVTEPPAFVRDGGFVAPGNNSELDEARALRDESRAIIAQMEADYRTNAGITALKIKHNNVLGYFVETPATHASKMMSEPLSDTFIHRQTTANAVRFTSVDLSGMETRIVNAGFRALEIEKAIFEDLRQMVLAAADGITETAKALSEIDVATCLAEQSARQGWSRPEIREDTRFDIDGGRHPVVEKALLRQGEQFVANDCNLSGDGDAGRLWLLTGPNMAGKSTFLRQNALIAILAQSGCHVPATRASIGIVDQVFSRVGAADDLARGRSTFMVEMVETAAILNQAGSRALVILDEIGRGTATHDGLAIAWATLEHLHDANRCRALFATHYHELTELAGRLEGVRNATVAVKEWEGDVVFLHEVRPGAADRSYGVQVARLAGLPAPVIERARDVLMRLETEGREGRGVSALADDLPLFSVVLDGPPAQATPQNSSALTDMLRDISPDSMTPKQALEMLYELKDLIDD